MRMDLAAVERCLEEVGSDAVVCVMTTSSCFAPRGCDMLVDVAKLCQQHVVPHIINNAYGVPSAFICR